MSGGRCFTLTSNDMFFVIPAICTVIAIRNRSRKYRRLLQVTLRNLRSSRSVHKYPQRQQRDSRKCTPQRLSACRPTQGVHTFGDRKCHRSQDIIQAKQGALNKREHTMMTTFRETYRDLGHPLDFHFAAFLARVRRTAWLLSAK